MKHIIYAIVFVVIGAFSLTSCDDFLNMQPTNSGNASGAIATPADAKVALNGIMSSMTSSSYYGRNFFMYGDAKGGDLTIYSAGRGLDGLYSFSHTPTSGSYSGFWTVGYYCIMQINNLLENINRLQEAGTAGLDFYEGQALTLRALIYFDLVRLYGLPYNYNKTSYGVPLAVTTLNSDAQLTRATVEENYDQILEDLAAGKTLLASDKSVQKGYIGYYANLAIEARVKLYMENYDGALTAAKEIINDNKYQLYTPSAWVNSWSSEFGSESIFELGIYPTESDLGTSSLGFYLMRIAQVTGASGYFYASDYYLNRLGEDPEDVRWGIMDEDEYWYNTQISRKGACYKYMGGLIRSDGTFPGDGKESQTAVNIKVIRLSEIYLIAAEAALNASTPDKEAAASYLNEIRKRAPNLPPATAATITDEMILDERSKELFAEGQRFFDMIRKNKIIEFNDDFQDIPVSTRNKTIDRTFYKIVLPISQDEINVNPAIGDQQNSGY
ncbi:MAG: SusD family protein [Bacteroidetes bacterium 38_7]|nr:MAG: SusD family protein [Bacteroidetes bacterium 38_7]MDK2842793.1 starch-binding outer membrane protein SusD/RagB family [Anaerophaga sp.]MDN5292579.1 starch-binding outer membrane protein SusD/RagB family [Anaerophaga sp.]